MDQSKSFSDSSAPSPISTSRTEECIEKSKLAGVLKSFLARPQDKFLRSEIKEVLQAFLKPKAPLEDSQENSSDRPWAKSGAIEKLDELLKKFKEKSQ